MGPDVTFDGAPTRRDYLKYGGTVVGSGLLVGCSDQDGSDDASLPATTETETDTKYFHAEIVSHLEEHDVASQLRAVQNDRVIYGGLTYQGSIIHLFQFERAAGGLYPEEFGDERLFDRQEVADIVNGEI